MIKLPGFNINKKQYFIVVSDTIIESESEFWYVAVSTPVCAKKLQIVTASYIIYSIIKEASGNICSHIVLNQKCQINAAIPRPVLLEHTQLKHHPKRFFFLHIQIKNYN